MRVLATKAFCRHYAKELRQLSFFIKLDIFFFRLRSTALPYAKYNSLRMAENAENSMWLQESITVPDPIPNKAEEAECEAASELSPPVTSVEKTQQSPVQQEIQKINDEGTAEISFPRAPQVDPVKSSIEVNSVRTTSVQRCNSSARYSLARVPSTMPGSSLIAAQEYDDLRLRFSKAKRELIRLSDIQKDLEFSRFELAKSQEEMKVIRDSHQKMKAELEEAIHRADQDRRAKVDLELKLADSVAKSEKEVEFLRRQIDDLREEGAKRLHELNEQQESEAQMRIEAMRAELSGLAAQMDGLSEQLDDVTAQKSSLEATVKAMSLEKKNVQLTVADLEKRLQSNTEMYQTLDKHYREYVSQAEKRLEDELNAQTALHDEHSQQIIAAKDRVISELKEEIDCNGKQRREFEDELASLRHKNQQLQEEMTALVAKHEKALRHLTDEHQLAISEKQLALEAAVREAKGSRTAVDEENQSLQRQIVKLTEELSTVSSVLAQREKQKNILDKDNDRLREIINEKEHEAIHLTQQVEVGISSLNEASERVSRLMAEKDAMEEEFEQDIKEYKAKNRTLEATLMECRKDLLAARKEQVETADELRITTNELKSQINELTAECNALRLNVKQLRNGESEVEDIRRQLQNERRAADDLRSELTSAVTRCQHLEEKLNERRVHEISMKNSRSPIPSSQGGQSSLRSVDVNVLKNGKRERPEDARVFGISGYETQSLFAAIKTLPNVAIAECKSNMPVPSNLTHLITNGQLTIKLLSSLVKGCWILPESYVLDSLDQKEWLPEQDYGFQHEIPPLKDRKVFMTPAFIASRNFNMASVLINEGNGIIVEKEKDADIVLCTNNDSRFQENVSQNGPVMNWECFVDTIYPQKIK